MNLRSLLVNHLSQAIQVNWRTSSVTLLSIQTNRRPIVIVVCRIAREAVLSAKSCGVANILMDWFGLEGLYRRTALTLAVLYEMACGETSPWYGYLQSLPLSEPLPLLWSADALAWLKGTAIESSLAEDRVIDR
jgi:hypothetical protein